MPTVDDDASIVTLEKHIDTLVNNKVIKITVQDFFMPKSQLTDLSAKLLVGKLTHNLLQNKR